MNNINMFYCVNLAALMQFTFSTLFASTYKKVSIKTRSAPARILSNTFQKCSNSSHAVKWDEQKLEQERHDSQQPTPYHCHILTSSFLKCHLQILLCLMVHSTKLLNFDWSRAVHLYPKLYSVGVPIKFQWKRSMSSKFERHQKHGRQSLCNFNGFIFTK